MNKKERLQYDAIAPRLQLAIRDEIQVYGDHGALIDDILINICPDTDGQAPRSYDTNEDGIRVEMVAQALKDLIERREIFYRLVNMRETYYTRRPTGEFDWTAYLDPTDNKGDPIGHPAPGTKRCKDFFYGGI